MTSFIAKWHSIQMCFNGYFLNIASVLTICIAVQLVTACSSLRQVAIIDVSNRSNIEADVSLVKMPDTEDLFGQLGKAYRINAGNQFASVRIPIEVEYDLGNLDPANLFIAKYSEKLKRFTSLESQVNLKDGFVTAKYSDPGIYTLFSSAFGGIDYDVSSACQLDLGSLDIGTSIVRDRICPVILCTGFADERNFDFGSLQGFGDEPFPLPGPSGSSFPSGNLCDLCLSSFGRGRPTICEPRSPSVCIPERAPPIARAELTQRGAFDPAGEACFVTAKTILVKVPAMELAQESTATSLSELRLDIYEGDNECGALRGTVSGFTYDTDNVTQLQSVPLSSDVFFIVPGSMLSRSGNYEFFVSGRHGSDLFAGNVAAQWFKRGGDLTIVAAPVGDALNVTTELPGVLADFDHLARTFPVRDGVNAAIVSPTDSTATGVMFFLAAPIPLAGFNGDTNALRDDYNDDNDYDARLSAALLSESDRLALGFSAAGAAALCGTSTWNRNVGSDSDVLLQEVAHNLCQIETGSPNGIAADPAHSKNQLIGTVGYNLLDGSRIAAPRARSIMWPSEFSDRSRGFFEAFEWNKTCERMTANNYVGFQSSTAIEVTNELGDKWPTSFSMIGYFDDKGRIKIARSYMTNEPRSEYVAKKSDYYVVFNDSKGNEITRYPLAISHSNEHHEDGNHESEARLKKTAFTFVSSFPPATMQVAIIKDNKVLAKIEKSQFAPQITEFNIEKTISDELLFSWSINDKDSQALSTSILVSKDGGQSYLPVASNRKGNTLKWDPQLMAGGIPLLFQIKVTDGFHVAKQQYKNPIALKDKAPMVSIFSPQDNENIQSDIPFAIRGAAWDAEEGRLNDEDIMWTVDGKIIAMGNAAVVPGFKAGKHKISITGTDSKQNERTFSIVVNVGKSKAEKGSVTNAAYLRKNTEI